MSAPDLLEHVNGLAFDPSFFACVSTPLASMCKRRCLIYHQSEAVLSGEQMNPCVLYQKMSSRTNHMASIPTSQHSQEVLDRHFVSAVVHFDVVTVEVQLTTCIGVDASGEFVARIAGGVVREHENNIRIWDSQPLDGSVPSSVIQTAGHQVDLKSYMPSAFAMCYMTR